MKYSYQQRKYGFFVHFVHGLCRNADGTEPRSFEDAVNGFDVNGFADAVASMGVEYLIFTAWHWRALPLYPSTVTEKYRGIKLPARDLLGEIIDAITARGIDMLLYTHPRDGHDFSPTEKLAIGWGKDVPGDRPDADTFQCDKWNEYTLALYDELLTRYGDKLSGIYTDGTGPYSKKSEKYENTLQVIDYTRLRHKIKQKNPQMCMIQNHFGYLFSDDFEMPEGYFGFEDAHFKDTRGLPAARKALALCPFVGGWCPENAARGTDARKADVVQLARFVIFNASCTVGGGTCFASGPYCEGNLFPVGVVDFMQKLGTLIRSHKESVLDAVPSVSYPTVSGDTMEKCAWRCFTESADGKYTYLHLLKRPETEEVKIPLAVDGAELFAPVSLCKNVEILDFVRVADGYSLRLRGEFDEVDSVIRFTRSVPENAPRVEWYNDSDKRLRYEGTWKYTFLMQDPATHTALGSFECDYHTAMQKGSAVFTYFEGNTVSLYGNKRPGNGKAKIYIDGVFAGETDENSSQTKNRTLLFTSIDLFGGVHTLYVVNDSDAPFELDAICITR